MLKFYRPAIILTTQTKIANLISYRNEHLVPHLAL